MLTQQDFVLYISMPIIAPNWIFSRFTTWIFGGVRIHLVGQCISKFIGSAALPKVFLHNLISIYWGGVPNLFTTITRCPTLATPLP